MSKKTFRLRGKPILQTTIILCLMTALLIFYFGMSDQQGRHPCNHYQYSGQRPFRRTRANFRGTDWL
jgi:hypothetical protein